MARFIAVTDDELARARRNPAYRQSLLTTNLEKLIDELNRCKKKKTADDPNVQRQLREGAELAVRLADIIARLDQQR